jgi:hypothetical protein
MCIIIYKVRSAVEWLQYGERCTIMTAPSAGVVSPSPELSMNWGRICLQDCSRWVIMPCTRHVLITPVLLTWPWTFLELHAPSPQPHRQRYGWVGLAHSNVNLNRTLILTPAANIITRTISINMIFEYARNLSWDCPFQKNGRGAIARITCWRDWWMEGRRSYLLISYIVHEEYKQKSFVELLVHFLSDFIHFEQRIWAEVFCGVPSLFSYWFRIF